MHEVELRIHGRAGEYKRGSYTVLKATSEDQLKTIRQLCEHMEKLMPEVKEMGGYVTGSAMPTIEILIRMAQEAGKAAA